MDPLPDPDLARTALPAGHLVLRRSRFLSAIPSVGQGDPTLAAARQAAMPPACRRPADRDAEHEHPDPPPTAA
jgi:hypothetical protein